MEYDLDDKLDLEWHSIFQKYIRHFLYKNKSKTYSFEELLQEVFCPDSNAEHADKEIFEKCLIEALSLLSTRQTRPRQTQVRYLLNIAKHISRDESCFINLKANNVFLKLMCLPQPSTDINTKLLFMAFFGSLVEHPSGVKWLMETKYWTGVFTSTVHYQNIDVRVSKLGYEILRIILEKTVDIDKNYCEEIMTLIAKPLLKVAQQINLMVPENAIAFNRIKPNMMCLVEILEVLLKNYGASVLQFIVDFKVGLACDIITEKCTDVEICLLLDRISIILSLFGFTEVFDGIKSIQENPLVLSAFINIINKEIDKGLFTVIYELLHYALKYIHYISNKLPKYFVGEKQIDTESQLVAFQLQPILIEWRRIDGATDLLEETDADSPSTSPPLKIFRSLCLKPAHTCFKIRDNLPPRSFDIFIIAVENITRSKDFYSKKSLCDILNTLVYALEAPLRYIQSKKNEIVTIEHEQQLFIFALLEATLAFIEFFNFNWHDSVKVLDLLYIVIESSSSYHQWIEPVILDCLKLLQVIISRRFSPSMALLMDTADGLKNIGPLLYKTCFTNNWKIRKAVLDVAYTITLSANTSFSSFKAILFDASLPSLISTMALNDESLPVRATALKCIQQMIVMDNIDEMLPKNSLIDKVLDIVKKYIDAEVSTEAIKLIATIYKHEKYLDKVIKMKIYKCLEYAALLSNNADNVQKELVDFWRMVSREFMANKGWVDTIFKFPPVTFSKRIIYLTTEEVNKRCYKVLRELSHIGCLNVFKKLFESKDEYVDAKKSITENLYRFHYTFSAHKITPESMLIYQELVDLSSIDIDLFAAPQESEDILQQIIRDATMDMMPGDLEYITNQVPLTLMDTPFLDTIDLNTNVPSSTSVTADDTRRITPAEFVDLVYKKVLELSANGQTDIKNEDPSADVYIIDY